MEFFGIQFAPLRVPLQRRLQTLAAAAWICVLGFGGVVSWLLAIYLILFTEWIRYFMFIYLGWIYYDRNTCSEGGRGQRWTSWNRNSAWWKYFCDYFPLKLVKTVDLDPSKNYLFCSFPHGILATGAFGAFATEGIGFSKLFPNLVPRIVTLRQHFMVPFFREFIYGFGACESGRDSIECLLNNHNKISNPNELNNAVVLVVGGAAESLRCRLSQYNIILSKRKGFIRVALKTGAPLVPIFSFGETDLYDQIKGNENSLLYKSQEAFRKLTGLSPVLLIGRGFFQYTFGLVPQRKPVTIVVGEPMEVPKILEPTNEQIDEYHAKFKSKLIELFETEKYKYLTNPQNTKLVIE
ncbi:hypothetical protein PV326_003642 [Microctonus aethiopoides]|uniref:Acyltransferase n=1 Tax=Microctonus aethiopoides TaxID=144406 RepID=A0AA39KK51_9HYME|nr:hypothetical protein PV326_003642 [Microctonus aethiopoides]KAK0164291.1 hypothetical protein PV328_002936 [Microctonus aethiopoides]